MPSAGKHELGISLIEVMVGVTIGLIAVIVMYQVFAVAEGFKRNTTGASDAQQNGLFSTFTLGIDLANAGNGLAAAAAELATCPNTGDMATTLRPLSVLITDGGSADTPDSFVVNYSGSSTLVAPALFAGPPPGPTTFNIVSPGGGFQVKDAVVAISMTGRCGISRVTAVGLPDALGVVQISVTPAIAGALTSSAQLFNLGPQPRRTRFDVASNVLRTQDLFTPDAAPVPLAANVLNLKVQYGVDTNSDGLLDDWRSARDAYAPAALLAAPRTTIDTIKAIRIGIIVRSDQFDRDQTAKFTWTMFECGEAVCPGRLTGELPENWRYRVFEQVIPLRNVIWNSG